MSLSELLDQITDLKKELDGLLPMAEENKRALDKKFRLEFNYNSNHIEGNTLTYGETELLLIFDETRGSHPHRDYEEMKASDVTLEMITELAREEKQPLTETFIKTLNQILLVRPYWKDAITPDGQTTKRKITVGDYKKYPNSVRLSNGEIFNYSSPIDTPAQMSELIDWLRGEEEKKELHPVEIAALVHYRFVRIHPFDDGNGRISRLLMNYILIKNNFPPVIIKADDKKNYLSALHDADTGNINSFKAYIAEQLIWSLEINIKAAKNEPLEESEDWKKKIVVLKKELANKDSIQIIKSDEVLENLIDSKILPFALSLLPELNDFNEFFLNKVLYWSATDPPRPLTSRTDLSDIHISYFRNSLTLTLSFEDFRKDEDDAFTIYIELRFEFSRHKYKIYFNRMLLFTKLYHHEFTNAEHQEIVNKIGEYVISTIEKRILDRLK